MNEKLALRLTLLIIDTVAEMAKEFSTGFIEGYIEYEEEEDANTNAKSH